MIDRQPQRDREHTRLVAASPVFRVQTIIPQFVYIEDCSRTIRQLHRVLLIVLSLAAGSHCSSQLKNLSSRFFGRVSSLPYVRKIRRAREPAHLLRHVVSVLAGPGGWPSGSASAEGSIPACSGNVLQHIWGTFVPTRQRNWQLSTRALPRHCAEGDSSHLIDF
jgi:hypothetical protein